MTSPAESPLEGAGVLSRLYWTLCTRLAIPRSRHLPYLPPSRLAALQDRRVRRIVAHAYSTVPFYRDAMDNLGLRPGDFRTAGDLARLPVVSGEELARDPARFLSSSAKGRPLLELCSSGSSGFAKSVAWNRAAIFACRIAGARQRDALKEALQRSGWRVVSVGRVGGTPDKLRMFESAHSLLPAYRAIQRPRAHIEDSFEHNLAVVNDAKPHLLQGFGSYIGALFRWAHARGHAMHRPRLVLYAGDCLSAPDRRFIEVDHGIPVVSSYQACEAFRIGLPCPRGVGFHIHVDHVVVRIADREGRTLPPGRHGRIVLSNLVNRATVLLNYDMGDRGAVVGDPCGCGRTLPLLSPIDGRSGDLVIRPDGEHVHESALLTRLFRIPNIIRLQIVQESLDRFRIRLVYAGTLDAAQLRERMTEALADGLGRSGVDLQVEILDDLPSEPSGKFKTVISHVKSPE